MSCTLFFLSWVEQFHNLYNIALESCDFDFNNISGVIFPIHLCERYYFGCGWLMVTCCEIWWLNVNNINNMNSDWFALMNLSNEEFKIFGKRKIFQGSMLKLVEQKVGIDLRENRLKMK